MTLSRELTLVIPTYNEYHNIRPIVASVDRVLKEGEWEIIFVDDDSPDGTAALIREISNKDARIRCIQRLGRRGLASAAIEGILASSSPYIAVMDADFQHDETILPEMLKSIKENGTSLVLASRYINGGSTGELGTFRTWISSQGTRLLRFLLKTPVTDPLSGFFMIRRPFFESVMRKLSGKGFKILLDIILTAGEEIKISEIPYIMRKRTHGASKLDGMVIWNFFTLVIYKCFGRVVPYRFLSFATVGFSGIFVHLGSLWLMYRSLKIEFIYSQITATIIAMTSNYILNNELTFKEDKLRGRNWIYGLFTFYAACTFGAIINVAVADLLFDRSIQWLISGAAGAISGAIWNYAVSATFTWKSSINNSSWR